MYFKYECQSGIVSIFVWGDKFHDEVIVNDPIVGKECYCTIEEDLCGKFCVWNGEKIYLENWMKTSMQDLKVQIANGESVTHYDLCQAILSDGVENVRFLMPAEKGRIYRIKEEPRRMVKMCYKVILVSEGDKRIDLYLSDVLGLIKSGYLRIVV